MEHKQPADFRVLGVLGIGTACFLWKSKNAYLERETGLEPATPTLARSCSTN